MIPGIVESSRWISPFSDTFNRTDTTTMATTGIDWVETIPDWQIVSNKAYTATATSSYPLLSFDSKKLNVTIKATGNLDGAGFGVAFWVKDASNWWAVVTDVTQGSTSGTTYTCPSGGTLSGTTCLKTCYQTCYQTCYNQCCSSGTCVNYGNLYEQYCGGGGYAYGCHDSGGCSCAGYDYGDVATCTCYSGFAGYAGGQFGCFPNFYASDGKCYYTAVDGTVPAYWYAGTVTGYVACNPYNCNPYDCNPYSCDYAATANTSTITTYTHTMKLIKNVAGTISTVATVTHGTDNTTPVYFTSMQVNTNGSTISATGLRNGVSVNLTNTPTSPTTSTKHGIILAPVTTTALLSRNVDQFDYLA